MTIKSDQLIDASVDRVQARTWITKSNKHAPRAKTETATFLREPNHVPCNPKRKWRVRLLRDKLTGEHEIEIVFRDRQDKREVLLLSAAQRSETPSIMRALDSRNARLPDNKKARLDFVAEIIRHTPSVPVTKTVKPGFRDNAKTFVMPSRTYGAGEGRYVWGGDEKSLLYGEIKGRLADYQKKVLGPAGNSPILSFGVMLALAAPLLSYVHQRLQRKLLSETAVFHCYGDTSTGKTTTVSVTESVFGAPDQEIDWRATERGFAEAAYSRNDLVLCIDDTEKSGLDDSELALSIRHVGHRVPAGTSKEIARTAKKSGYPSLHWSCFAISNGPSSIARIGRGMNRGGQVVRFLEIKVPSAQRGGVLGFGALRCPAHATKRIKLINRIETGIAAHHGMLFDAWIGVLLQNDLAQRVVDLVDEFMEKVAPSTEAVHRRIAKKFAIIYAAGALAIDHGLLPWKEARPLEVTRLLFRRALKLADPEGVMVEQAIKQLAVAVGDPSRLVRYAPLLK